MKKSSYWKRNKQRGHLTLSDLTGSDWFWAILIILALLSILRALINVPDSPSFNWWHRLVEWYKGIEPFVKMISWIISAILVYGIAYSVTKRNKIFELEGERLNPPVEEPLDIYSNKKWERVLAHLESNNQSDWKLAILEADIMLDELLDKSGYKGETMGEKLKQVEKSDFNTIDQAWEAHKIRNMVAHEGSEYSISEREAQRVIRLYESVFKEFHFI